MFSFVIISISKIIESLFPVNFSINSVWTYLLNQSISLEDFFIYIENLVRSRRAGSTALALFRLISADIIELS